MPSTFSPPLTGDGTVAWPVSEGRDTVICPRYNHRGEDEERPGHGAAGATSLTTVMSAPPGAVPPFETIVAEYGPLISRIASSYEADPSLREDLTQQIFLAVWQALPTWRSESSLKTFIARVAQNRSISFVTKQVRQGPVAELQDRIEADAPNPEEQAMQINEREMLMAATRRLPLPQRQVIILVLEGFTYPEISEMLEIAPNALALRLSRAKAALKAMLEGGE